MTMLVSRVRGCPLANESMCARCRTAGSQVKNNVPGAYVWETPEQTEERKWICYLMRSRSRALSRAEKSVLDLLFGLNGSSRRSGCKSVAEATGLSSGADVHKIADEALRKICYRRDAAKRRA